MRFHAHDRILEILVGSNLYPGPDVSIRELVQNAWDAIELRRAYGDGEGGQIIVRYSRSGSYFEVEDDGIGMSEEDLEDSFLAVGSDKLEVLGAAGQAGEQVAIFGIGVLSVFLVARSLEVKTRKFSEAQGLRLHIEDLKDERDPEPISLDRVGTTLHIQVRDDVPFDVAEIPEAVCKYARHLTDIFIEDVDSGERTETQETWDTDALLDVSTLPEDGRVREGA
jgi:HSP90 family molecular chaperone